MLKLESHYTETGQRLGSTKIVRVNTFRAFRVFRVREKYVRRIFRERETQEKRRR